MTVEAFICDAIRTPFGRYGGALSSVRTDDLAAIRDLTLEMRDEMLRHAKARGTIGRIVASVNPLVPKPGTAYQWLPMEDPAVTDRKIKRLRSLMAGIDNVYFTIKSERHSYYQGLLSLGDRRVADVIERAEANGGNWRAAVADSGAPRENSPPPHIR